ncbi:hypothetical protein [Rubrimonas cliftonensis]|uniref:Uncharacterized protein n=1 Tax=Rubrimonas cliftonensis TaxID=89524 RepID=A0A1H3X9K2_9RHOB|nr:hypothetical protein [Rubrimonas cliftonensis]SDZ95963.1 hypothetical protein SAMN05444370_102330 [Rubrimonas cliftonensis]
MSCMPDAHRRKAARLRADLDAVNEPGAVEGLPGVNRRRPSDADMAARRWLAARREAAGLAGGMDAAGDVRAAGRRAAAAAARARARCAGLDDG